MDEDCLMSIGSVFHTLTELGRKVTVYTFHSFQRFQVCLVYFLGYIAVGLGEKQVMKGIGELSDLPFCTKARQESV